MEITLYTRPGCGACMFTKKQLEQLGLTFTEKNIDADEAAYEEVVALGYQELPVVVAGDTHFSGYRPDELQALAEKQ